MTPSAQICVICGSVVVVLYIVARVFTPRTPKPDRTRYEAERHLECATQKRAFNPQSEIPNPQSK